MIPQGVPERGTTLVQDLLTVSDEQEPSSGHPRGQSRVVHRGHHGLASPRSGYEQILVASSVPRHLDEFEQAHLKWIKAYLYRAQED